MPQPLCHHHCATALLPQSLSQIHCATASAITFVKAYIVVLKYFPLGAKDIIIEIQSANCDPELLDDNNFLDKINLANKQPNEWHELGGQKKPEDVKATTYDREHSKSNPIKVKVKLIVILDEIIQQFRSTYLEST